MELVNLNKTTSNFAQNRVFITIIGIKFKNILVKNRLISYQLCDHCIVTNAQPRNL